MSFIGDAIADLAANEYEAPRPRIRIAGPVHRFVLRRVGFAGICWPWRTIYLLPEYADHPKLIAHEMIHIEQIDRHGPVRFTVLYLWYTLTRGYWANPFEQEAYRRQHDAA